MKGFNIAFVQWTLINFITSTYYDYITGNDKKESSGDRTLFDGTMTPRQVLQFSILSYVVALAIAGYVLYIWGRDMVWLFAVGMLLTFFYTARPIRLKARALGDVVIFLCFAPLPTMGVYFMQTHEWSLIPVIFSVPIGMHTVAILHANNTRDIRVDRAVGVCTVANLLGKQLSFYYYWGLLVVPYLIAGGVGIIQSRFMLFLVLLSSPIAFHLLRDFQAGKLGDLTERTGQFGFVFGILFVLGLWLS